MYLKLTADDPRSGRTYQPFACITGISLNSIIAGDQPESTDQTATTYTMIHILATTSSHAKRIPGLCCRSSMLSQCYRALQAVWCCNDIYSMQLQHLPTCRQHGICYLGLTAGLEMPLPVSSWRHSCSMTWQADCCLLESHSVMILVALTCLPHSEPNTSASTSVRMWPCKHTSRHL